MDLGAGGRHFGTSLDNSDSLGEWDGALGNLVPPEPRGPFAHTVWNPNVTATKRPHNAESFIILSAGPDGLYGSGDDVANFDINR